MKKTLKRIVIAILAVATVASTAFVFAGCGEKSDEEKAKDAVNSMMDQLKDLANYGLKATKGDLGAEL